MYNFVNYWQIKIYEIFDFCYQEYSLWFEINHIDLTDLAHI
jgi:hypothetical protein